eukprot:scaffold51814_cov17-Tisochrysis_lutea.AAC.1
MLMATLTALPAVMRAWEMAVESLRAAMVGQHYQSVTAAPLFLGIQTYRHLQNPTKDWRIGTKIAPPPEFAHMEIDATSTTSASKLSSSTLCHCEGQHIYILFLLAFHPPTPAELATLPTSRGKDTSWFRSQVRALTYKKDDEKSNNAPPIALDVQEVQGVSARAKMFGIFVDSDVILLFTWKEELVSSKVGLVASRPPSSKMSLMPARSQ